MRVEASGKSMGSIMLSSYILSTHITTYFFSLNFMPYLHDTHALYASLLSAFQPVPNSELFRSDFFLLSKPSKFKIVSISRELKG